MPDGWHWKEVAKLCTARQTRNTQPTKNDVSPKIPRTLAAKAIPFDDAHVDRSPFDNSEYMAARADAMVAAMVTAMRR